MSSFNVYLGEYQCSLPAKGENHTATQTHLVIIFIFFNTVLVLQKWLKCTCLYKNLSEAYTVSPL